MVPGSVDISGFLESGDFLGIAKRPRVEAAVELLCLERPGLVAALDNVAVVRLPVEQGCGYLGVAKDTGPFAEAQVRNHDAGVLVEHQQVEQQRAAGLAERQVAQLVER